MLTLIIFGLLSYALASIFLLLVFLGKKEVFYTSAATFSAIGFVMLSFISYKMLIPVFDGTEAITKNTYLFSLACLFSLVLGVIAFRYKKSLLFSFASPLLFILLHTAMLAERNAQISYVPLEGMLFLVHIFAIFLALVLILVGSLSSILFLIQEKVMKQKHKKIAFMKNFPSWESLDRINYATVIVGFPSFTIGLICGFIWAGTAWGTIFSGDIKEIVSIFIWICYALLFHMRVGLSYKGRKPALAMLFICLLSIFSLLGINTFFDTHHKF